jgi:integrase
MKSLEEAVEDYLRLRRGLGFKLDRLEGQLRQFLSFLSVRRVSRITTQLALEFATEAPELCPGTMAMRLAAVRCFARYHAVNNPATEVPPNNLLPRRTRGARPYIYSESEIVRLLAAARRDQTPSRPQDRRWQRYNGWSWHCLFALLIATGMRVSEVCNLRTEDIDWEEGVLTICNTKFGKSRLVPLHETMLQALRTHVKQRDAFLAQFQPGALGQCLFVTSRGTPIQGSHVREKFLRISRQIGLRGPNDRHRPRLHDLRHRFAVQTLIRWYRMGENVDALLPVLSTYLGHIDVGSTYWYLRCTPELMDAARTRLERRWEGVL